MNRADLQQLARVRLREAKVLLKANEPCGAYYLAGYAVEVGLKACIAKTTKRFDFPDKQRIVNAHVHDLVKLVGLADLRLDLERECKTNPTFDAHWAVVKDWSSEKRYDRTIDQRLAMDLHGAITRRNTGVMTWVRRHW